MGDVWTVVAHYRLTKNASASRICRFKSSRTLFGSGGFNSHGNYLNIEREGNDMCKYCDDLKKDGEANLCASTNDMGVLGQADMVTRIVDYGNDRFVLKTLGMPFTAFNSLSYPFVRIEFCPM